MKREKLKAPYPYFGGKSTVADIVWSRLGNVDNYCEPFYGSGAVLLARPGVPRIETVNDLDCYVSNFWRATQADPEAVVDHADGPVNEADLHARHRWLVLSDDAKAFRQRMRTEPGYFDARIAGWWCWGLCCWIGSGWCSVAELRSDGFPREKMIHPRNQGIRSVPDQRKPRIDGGEGQYGHGIHAKGELSQAIPVLSGDVNCSSRDIHGVLAQGLGDTNRPQLADACSRGRGVNGNDDAGTCAQRRQWLLDWFSRLRDRLRTVRVCCGDWLRVCDSDSVTTRLGLTGIFFDPPYGAMAGRNTKLYSQDSGTVAGDVRAYCLERGQLPGMRIALCGYAGEGHEALEASGWECVAWQSQGGYGNRSARGKANAKKERMWFSPHCDREISLFGGE